MTTQVTSGGSNGGLKGLARLSGVAASSVSRALAGKPGVSDRTRAEILRLAEKTGYRVNREARALRTGRLSDIMIVVQDHPNEITSYRNYALLALGGNAFDRIRTVTVGRRASLDDVMLGARDEGVALAIVSGVPQALGGDAARSLAKSRFSAVFVDSPGPRGTPGAGFDSIVIDRQTGARAAAALLISRGTEGVSFYAKPKSRQTDERMAGIAQAYADIGAHLPPESVIPIHGDDAAEGLDVTRRLLRKGPVRALFCYNDNVALGALKAIHDAGLTCPKDVWVVGFDDLSFAPYLSTPLTTVAQPVQPCAEAAVELAARRRDDRNAAGRRLVFETRLVLRETTPSSDASTAAAARRVKHTERSLP